MKMKKALGILAVIALLVCMVTALAETGSFRMKFPDGTQHELTYEGHTRNDKHELVVRVGGFGSTFQQKQGTVYLPVLLRITRNHKDYDADRAEMSTSGVYTFYFTKDTPNPETISIADSARPIIGKDRTYHEIFRDEALIASRKAEEEKKRLDYADGGRKPEDNPEFLKRNGDKNYTSWYLAYFTIRTPDLMNEKAYLDRTCDMLDESYGTSTPRLILNADGTMKTMNFDKNFVSYNTFNSQQEYIWKSAARLGHKVLKGWRCENGIFYAMPRGDKYEIEIDEASRLLRLSFKEPKKYVYVVSVDENGDEEWTGTTTTVEFVMEFLRDDAFDEICDVPKTPIDSPDNVFFGRYEQDNDPDNGPEEIEWIVLKNEGQSLLLTSKYVLDVAPYNQEYEPVTWDKCSLRAFLNGEFLNTAFTAEEQVRILPVTVSSDISELVESQAKDVKPGDPVEDKVWLLNYKEAKQLYASHRMARGFVTPYVTAKLGKENILLSPHWLRTFARCLFSNGKAGSFDHFEAGYVTGGGTPEGTNGPRVDDQATAVRPVILLKIPDAE